MIEDEFFPDSYDIGVVGDMMTICHLDRDSQTISIAQFNEAGGTTDYVYLDRHALTNLLSVLKSNISEDGQFYATHNNGNYLKYGFN